MRLHIPVEVDLPEHRSYRKILNPVTSPAAVGELQPMIERWTTWFVDQVIETGECDFAAVIGVPAVVTLDWLGLDVGSDIALSNTMAREIIHAGLANRTFIDNATEGYEDYAASVEAFTLAEGERLVGIVSERDECVGHGFHHRRRSTDEGERPIVYGPRQLLEHRQIDPAAQSGRRRASLARERVSNLQ